MSISVVRILLCVSVLSICDCFNDITSRVFDSNFHGVLSAFGDFNADKLTDVFVIDDEGSTVEVFLAQDKEPFLTKSSIRCLFQGLQVTSVVPGDYDGDSHMDVLLTFQSKKQKDNHISGVKILWGNLDTLDCSGNLTLPMIRGQPLVMDYDANKIPDLYVENENGSRQVWLISSNRTYVTINIATSSSMRFPHSNAFLDLNDDMAADIFVTLEGNQYEIWYNKRGEFHNPTNGRFPNASWIGQSNFVDIDVDGVLDHLVPVCQEANFHNCSIQILVHDKWLPLTAPLQEDGQMWGFDLLFRSQFPATIRAGDYNLDGYPDLVVILRGLDTKRQSAFLMDNLPCHGCQFPRRLVINSKLPSGSATAEAVLVAFYDVYQDGNLDVLVVGSEPDKSWTTSALENSVANDVSFIKVLVLSGLCYYRCQHSHKPFGVNQPGPVVKYLTVRPDGSLQKGAAAQLPQSAHFALHLPYTVFGLGQTPNFVDDLHVGVPRTQEQEQHTHTWHAIIPNSQMIVIPLQEDGTRYRWLNKLFVTPSHQVLITFVSLVGTCVFLVIIISALHWKEKAEDKKEKLQEAHRFHFDAM